MAFGTQLKAATIETKLYRKVSSINFLKSGELCFSTDSSVTLIGAGDFCIVLEKDSYTGMHDSQDADAGKNFGYDEFRIELTQNELLSKIEYIVVPNEWVDSEMDISADDYNAETDPYEWIENLSQYGIVIPIRDFETNINLNF